MILTGELKAHCLQVQEQAEQRNGTSDQDRWRKSEGVNEELKADRSDGLGSEDEQHQTLSGGKSC